MSYYKLPRMDINMKELKLNITLNNNIDNIDIHDLNNDTFICNNLEKYIKMMKRQIDKNIHEWDNYKKYTNPYEFIHTNIPNCKLSISKYKPISRAFFKLIEIYNIFKIMNNYINVGLNTFHLAEGPGGFIEATAYIRNNKKDNYYGMTLIEKNNNNIPGWKKSEYLLKKYNNIHIVKGHDNIGDLYNPKNLEYCHTYFKNSMDIITGDGGFDFSINYEHQEQNAIRLILTQTLYALTMQKYNGIFILKIFDIFMKSTTDIIHLLSYFYKSVFIIKPHTSRYANSEKYVVCKYFKFKNVDHLIKHFLFNLNKLSNTDFNKVHIKSIIDIPYSNLYLTKLIEINTILGQQQIDTISLTIKHIIFKNKSNEQLKHLQKINIDKCINWCKKNNICYNEKTVPKNIFLGK